MTEKVNNSTVIFSEEGTLVVNHESLSRCFVVTHVESGKAVKIPEDKLMGTVYKYPIDFISAFRKPFADMNISVVVITKKAEKAFWNMLEFNRIDS